MNLIDQALALLDMMVMAIAREPGQIRREVDRSPGVMIISYTGNPSDTRRLVGSSGIVIHQLSVLLRLLLRRERGIAARIERMIPNDATPAKWGASVQKAPAKQLEALLQKLAEAVFEVPATVTSSTRDTTSSIHLTVRIDQDELDSSIAEAFGKSCFELFGAVGKKYNTTIYVHVAESTGRANELRAGSAA